MKKIVPKMKVKILPIDEIGEVKICRNDDRGEMIIEVIREDKKIHLCRECEINFI